MIDAIPWDIISFIGLAVLCVYFIIRYFLVKWCDTKDSIGILRYDRSIENEEPYLFLEFQESPDWSKIHDGDIVKFVVSKKNYLTR